MRLLSWQERLAALRDVLLWDHALLLSLHILRVAQPAHRQACLSAQLFLLAGRQSPGMFVQPEGWRMIRFSALLPSTWHDSSRHFGFIKFRVLQAFLLPVTLLPLCQTDWKFQTNLYCISQSTNVLQLHVRMQL